MRHANKRRNLCNSRGAGKKIFNLGTSLFVSILFLFSLSTLLLVAYIYAPFVLPSLSSSLSPSLCP